jgi:heptosyltransferase-1
MPNILVVRLGAMGDILHALPAVAAMRQALAGARIGWVVEERWSELLCARGAAFDGPPSAQKPIVNRVHPVNTRQWREALLSGETWKRVGQVRRQLQSEEYDLAIDLQGAWKSALMARQSGNGKVAGPFTPREPGVGVFYNVRVRTHSAHVIEQAMEIVLGALAALPEPVSDHQHDYKLQTGSGPVILPNDPNAEAWCDQQPTTRKIARFAILSPTAGWPAKEWPAARFGEVATRLAKEGLSVIVNVGPGEREQQIGHEVEQASNGKTQMLTCGIGELIALTRRASLFIAGDTGPMHLAAMLGIPTLALFGPTDPARNGPFYPKSQVLRDAASVTTYSHANQSDPGLMKISVDQVSSSALELLKGATQ